MGELLESVPIDEIRQWVPVEVSAAETADYIFNKSLHPFTVSTNEKTLYLEQAVAHTLIQCAALANGSDARWPIMGERPSPPPFGLLLATRQHPCQRTAPWSNYAHAARCPPTNRYLFYCFGSIWRICLHLVH